MFQNTLKRLEQITRCSPGKNLSTYVQSNSSRREKFNSLKILDCHADKGIHDLILPFALTKTVRWSVKNLFDRMYCAMVLEPRCTPPFDVPIVFPQVPSISVCHARSPRQQPVFPTVNCWDSGLRLTPF